MNDLYFVKVYADTGISFYVAIPSIIADKVRFLEKHLSNINFWEEVESKVQINCTRYEVNTLSENGEISGSGTWKTFREAVLDYNNLGDVAKELVRSDADTEFEELYYYDPVKSEGTIEIVIDNGGPIMNERQEIYDRLCGVLTLYEHGESDPEDLYEMLVEIQNRWEDVITAQ